MTFDEHAAASTRIKNSPKKLKGEYKDAAMDLASEIDVEERDRANKKRKAEVLEGDGDTRTLTKKERKRLRKLSKEKVESATILQGDYDILTKGEKKAKKHKSGQQVCRLPLQVH